jgi:uncharacterized protein YdeI (YjbR/CyaY-like superfamily)
MDTTEKIAAYFDKQAKWKEGLELLRSNILELGFKEEVKWGMPTYTMDGKNLIGLIGFKHNFGIWFFQGVFLSDPLNLLVNAQEGKTKGMRNVKFLDVSEVDIEALMPYFKETIKNHKEGKKIEVSRSSKPLEMPELLKSALEEKGMKAFSELSNSKQNEFKEYILTAKREATKLSRLEKIIPMILNGIGLNDKYK